MKRGNVYQAIFERGGEVPFLSNNTLGRQSQDIEASIPYESKVLGGSYGDSRVKEWRVFDSVAIEALSAVFEHG